MKLARDLTCAEIVELVTDYLEGGLSTEDRERFEEHIGYCDWCLTYLDQMRQTIATVGELREEDLSPELQGGLLDAFRDWSGP
jgi:predicted anti-sigma-YlaC factor YlaD